MAGMKHPRKDGKPQATSVVVLPRLSLEERYGIHAGYVGVGCVWDY
jgi:hypothetical protein